MAIIKAGSETVLVRGETALSLQKGPRWCHSLMHHLQECDIIKQDQQLPTVNLMHTMTSLKTF